MTLRHRLAGSVAVLALMQAPLTGAAFAQSAPVAPAGADSATASGNAAENIVVTGSRLKQSNATSESPVVVVTSAQIQHTSSQTLEEVLNKLPEIGTNGLANTTNNGGGGVSCLELRNLGIERTLILVDGKRFVQGNSSCVDLNNIPLEQVDRIEILKDGASTTYGADAIAGVINIILKHNFSGAVFHANGLIATDAGDDKTGELSALFGTNFDKGNFTASVEYLNQGSVFQKDRPYALNPEQSDGPLGSGPAVTGSGFRPQAHLVANANNPTQPKGYVSTDGTTRLGFANRFDFGSQQQLQDSLEKESFTTSTNYDVAENISYYLETFYTHKRTGEQLAPQPVSASLDPAVEPDAYVVPVGNPFLTKLFGANSGSVDLTRRNPQIGDRVYTQVDDTFQINTGIKGDLGAGWDYEVFFQYGQDDEQINNTNNINFNHLENEAGFQQVTAAQNAPSANNQFNDATTYGIYNPNVCNAAAGCVLSNPFGQLSQAALNYIKFTESQSSQYTLKVYGGNISNSELYQLPAGPLGVSLGVEHRTESGHFQPDSLDITGQTLAAVTQATNGSFNVTEVYGETRIPILKDLPGAKDLHIDLGGRYFDYNTSGSGETWKVSGNYTPIDGIRFRGSDGVAFRQPSTNDLFAGNAVSFIGALDPCAKVASYGSKAGIVQKNCAAQGIDTGTFQQAGSQVQTLVGGNPALAPETARTQTFGIVLTPSQVPRLAVTVDWSRTKVDNTVGNLTTQGILDNCYTSASFFGGGTANQCGFVTPRSGDQQLNTVSALNANLGVLRTEALDIGTTYSLPVSGYGILSFQNDATITLKYQEQLNKNGPFIGFLGTISAEGAFGAFQPAYPRLRDNASVDWHFGDISVGYRLRYIEGTVFDTYPAPFVQGRGDTASASAKTPDVFYHDIYGSYDYHNISVNVGVQNLFDKQPPYVFDTATNTDAQVYDILGRVVYLKTTVRF